MKGEWHNIPLEIKSITDDGWFSGYASIYNIEDNHNDIILSGAFCDSLRQKRYGKDIKLLWQHQTDEPVGVFTKVIEDDLGLYVEGNLLLNIRRAEEAFDLMNSGVLDGLSIGFTVQEYDYDEASGARLIYKADLWEISLVTFPANEDARILKIGKSKDILEYQDGNTEQNYIDNYKQLGKVLDKALGSLRT
jgi:hypothetical protein